MIDYADFDLLDLFREDPFATYYNLGGLTHWSLTCDIDWAPEYALEDLMQIVESFGVPITAFATHKSEILANAPSWLEVGLHPDNTRPHLEHGLKHKISELRDMYPKSIGVRAHRNFFGQNIAQLAAGAGLLYDCSVLNYGMPFCQGQFDQYGLARLSYCWEDGVHADLGAPWELSRIPLHSPGLKIFNVHPIFIYLNCPNDDYRRNLTKDFSDLQFAPKSAFVSHIYKGYGARSFLIDILKTMQAGDVKAVRLDELVLTARGVK